MAGLLSRLSRAAGSALEAGGEAALEDQRSERDQIRAERLERIRNEYAGNRQERKAELDVEAATVASGRAEETATTAYGRGVETASTLADVQTGQITHRVEEEYRVENQGVLGNIREQQVATRAESLLAEARDKPWSPRPLFNFDRWNGSKARAIADVKDKLTEGWTESQIFAYLQDEETPEGTPPSGEDTPPSGRATLDTILQGELKPGVTEEDVYNSILAEPRLAHLHAEAQAALDGQ